ncbi:6-phosphogluconolactonase [Candidatus Bipolaricaulota bacterium]|nr:6-phosphogluconolactonase [Candidatus Bipolaricaulota bacterium]
MEEQTEKRKEIGTISANDREELARRTTKKFYEALEELLNSEERVVVSLSGGRSVQPFYKKIPDMADSLSGGIWRRIHFFWTDERMVPPGSSDSNYGLAKDLFLGELMERGLVGPDQIHRFPGETSSSKRVIDDYRRDLDRISNGEVHLPVLGVGGDGHVGSLFPGSPKLKEDKSSILLVENSPKPPERRITISPGVIRESTYPFLFFIGEEKRDAYKCFRADTTTYFDCPCKIALAGSSGICYVVTELV